MDTAPRMLMLRFLLPVSELASFTCTVKAEVPIVVGVPVITPPMLMLNPAGRLPEVILKTKGCVPVPLATCTVALYGALTAPEGSVSSKITGAPAGVGLEPPPPHAARNTQRISANPSAANALPDLIGSPRDLVLRALANSNHISRQAFYTSRSGKL